MRQRSPRCGCGAKAGGKEELGLASSPGSGAIVPGGREEWNKVATWAGLGQMEPYWRRWVFLL